MGPTSSDFEIRDIIWEMGPPMPWPTKGQAQDVIGHRIVAAGAPGYPDWKPSLEYDTDEGWRVRERGKHNSGWILDTRTMEYGFLPNLPVGISWPKGQAGRRRLLRVHGHSSLAGRPVHQCQPSPVPSLFGLEVPDVGRARVHAYREIPARDGSLRNDDHRSRRPGHLRGRPVQARQPGASHQCARGV